MKKVNYKTYIKDAENGKKTLYVDEDQTVELADVVYYAKDDKYSRYLILASDKSYEQMENPELIKEKGDFPKLLNDDTADFYKIW